MVEEWSQSLLYIIIVQTSVNDSGCLQEKPSVSHFCQVFCFVSFSTLVETPALLEPISVAV